MQKLWKTVWKFLKKLKIELSCDPLIPLLGIYLEKTLIRKDTCTSMFTIALFTIVKTWKQRKCPSADEWIKMWCVCIYIYIQGVEVLTPSGYECDLIWKWGLCKCNQVKMRSLRWALFQYDWCPYQEGKCQVKRDTQGERHVTTEVEIEVIAAASQGTPRKDWLPPSETGKKLGGLCPESQRECGPADTRVSNF